MEQCTPLCDPQNVALDKLTTAVDLEYVKFLMEQGPDALYARFESFMQYETTLVG